MVLKVSRVVRFCREVPQAVRLDVGHIGLTHTLSCQYHWIRFERIYKERRVTDPVEFINRGSAPQGPSGRAAAL